MTAPASTLPAITRLSKSSRDGAVRFIYPDTPSVDLSALYHGRACFIVAGGPSLADMNLELLRSPGVMTWGVNNSWATFRPRLWTCVDPPDRFCYQGWLDPSITKVVPLAIAGSRLRFRDTKGELRTSKYTPQDMPNVLFFNRNGRFEPADFLSENTVCWGGDQDYTDPLGIKGHRSVFLSTVKLAFSMGFRHLYLCGCDFRMDTAKPYAFEQEREASMARFNNKQFSAMSRRFEALLPYFEGEGLRIVNCTPGSALKVFPSMRLSDAVKEATADCAGPMDTRGLYDGPPKDEWAAYRDGGGD